MHELAFSDAARPSPVVVLNLPLVEYSIGHELLLFHRRNALAMLSEGEFAALDFEKQLFAIREAVWLCSDTFSERDRFERPAFLMWRFRWNEWKRRRWVKRLRNLLPEDYALASAEFRNYLSAAHPRIPATGDFAAEALYGDEPNKGRAFGQPLIVSLYNFVITLPPSERTECAWDYPMAKATWLFFAQLESQGNYRIENFEEREEQAVMDEINAERAQRKSAQAAAFNPKPSNGLATPPPDLNAQSETQNPKPGEGGNA